MNQLEPDHLSRTINLRDLGGVQVADGRTVRRGLVFRSAALGELSAGELAALTALGLRSIIDLRHNSEREEQPTPWENLGCEDLWALDHQPPPGPNGLAELFVDESFTNEVSHKLMLGLYRELPFRHAEAVQRLLGLLARGEGPVLFHCTSGKDRTGMCAALLLSALGASREAIAADYFLTRNFDILGSVAFRDIPPDRVEALAPVYGVHSDFLDAMYASIEARSGSVEAYLRDVVGLTDLDLEKLRENLLA